MVKFKVITSVGTCSMSTEDPSVTGDLRDLVSKNDYQTGGTSETTGCKSSCYKDICFIYIMFCNRGCI